VAASCSYLGANVKLTVLHVVKDQQKLRPRQFITRLFNSEVNLISDWEVEHKPRMVSNKRYNYRTKNTLKFVFQEDLKFNLAGDTVQVWDDVSPRNNVHLHPLDCARFLSLSYYSVLGPINPKFFGMVMGLSKDNNVAMIFSKACKRRCQQINTNVWVEARKKLDLAQYVAYTNVRGKHAMALTQHMCDTATIRIRLVLHQVTTHCC
jgi:hypothetical protein